MAGSSISTQRLRPVGWRTSPRSGSQEQEAEAQSSIGGRVTPRLMPMGVGELLDRAIELFSGRFALCLGLAFLVQVPTTYVVTRLLEGARDPSFIFLVFIPGIAGHVLTTVLVASAVGPAALGRGRAVPLNLITFIELSALVVVTASGAVLLFCCIVPGVAWMWFLSVVPMAYLFEPRVGGPFHLRHSVRRGIRLVGGLPSLGRWVGIFVVRSLVFLPMGSLLGSFEFPAVRAELREALALSAGGMEVFEIGLTSLFQALGAAFGAILLVVYYVDLRTRREGLDLELSLARLPNGPSST